MTKAGKIYRITSDHLGSVRLVVETATGTIAQRIDYDSFGNTLNDTNPAFLKPSTDTHCKWHVFGPPTKL